MNDALTKPKILIVDDNPENIHVLSILKNEYELLYALSGEEALETIFSGDLPDIILLDIIMPGMDGYEVCKRLKKDEKSCDIPVIFISAMDDLTDKVRGFSLNAVDYITKPFQIEEVLARVKTHISVRTMQKKLEKQNNELIELVRLREDIESITRHDLRNPLQGILGYCELMINENPEKKYMKAFKKIRDAGFRIQHMINLSLDLLKIEKGTYVCSPVCLDILKLTIRVINANETIIKSKELSLEIFINSKPVKSEDEFHVLGEDALCYSMLMNLIINALEASPTGERITISLRRDQHKSLISIHNKRAVPENIRDRFFEKYVTSGKQKGTGLGTYSAKLIAETQGGSVHLETGEESGTTVTIWLPGISKKIPMFNR